MNLSDKAKKIRALVLDIDGVLTDGRIGYDGSDDNEIKFFHTRDGHGMKLAMRAGLIVGLLSGRECATNRRRAAELGLNFCYEKCLNKGQAFDRLLTEFKLDPSECLYIGDDVIDAPPMRKAGIAVVVADGEESLDQVADFRTKLPGGHGAVREVINWLLKEQEKFDGIVTEKYFK